MQILKDTVSNPALTRSNPNIFNQANNNPVTYYYRTDGYYVVIDDLTGFGWIDEMTNQIIETIK